MPAGFQEGVESKKWQERKESMEALLALITANPRLCPKANYGELVSLLRRILEKDANINVCALAGKCLTVVALGLRAKFAPHAATVVPVILEKFKEKKPLLRDPLVECIDAVAGSTSLESMEEDIVAALGKANPSIKTQTGLFLMRSFKKHSAGSIPKKTLKQLVPLLVKHTGDSDAEVRDACYAALGAAMCIVGEKAAMVLLADIADDKLKMPKIREFCEKVREEVGVEAQPVQKAEVPAVQQPAKAPPKPAKEEETVDEGEKATKASCPPKKEKANVVKKESPAEEEEEGATKKKNEELLSINENKHQRMKDEKTLKLLKWNFPTPDDEHVNQLMTLLGAEAKTSLLAMLFHKDFKMHIKAIETISKMAETQPDALIKNSDLLLKWCTLRFFETNPAVLIKVLELARLVLELCQQVDEPFPNEEIQAFLPYLLLKSGEQKENMRAVVREILDTLSNIAGPLRLCPLVIEGLKTKNSRQRAECLLVLEKYVSTVGLGQLKTQGIVKAMAGCVCDRDTNVRNAAINGMVAAYREDGDRIWSLTGKMADKDKALVDERIKRSGAAPGGTRPVGSTPATAPGKAGGPRIVSQPNGTVVRRPTSGSRLGSRTRDSSPVSSRDEGGEARGRSAHNDTFNATAKRFTLDDSDEETSGSGRKGADPMTLSAVLSRLEAVEIANPSSRWSNAPLKRSNSSSSIASVDTLDQLDKVIQNISSALPDVSSEALAQVQYLLGVDEQRPLLGERIDIVLQAVAAQLKLQRTVQLHDDEERTNERIRLLLNFMTTLVNGDAREFSRSRAGSLECLFTELVAALVDEELQQLKDGTQVTRSLNVICVRSVTRGEPAAVFAALAEALNKALEQKQQRPADLLIKCIHKLCSEMPTKTVLQVDPMVHTANDFFSRNAGREGESAEMAEAIKAVSLAFEKLYVSNSLKANEAVRRLPRAHPKLREMSSAFAARLPPGVSLPGQIPPSAATANLNPLVANLIKDHNNMAKSVAILGDHISHNKGDAATLEKQVQTLPLGVMMNRRLREYVDYREGRAENPPVFPSAPVLAVAERMRRLLGQDSAVSVLPSLPAFPASPASSGDLNGVSSAGVPPPSQPIRKRRTMNPAELAPLKERLNQINS